MKTFSQFDQTVGSPASSSPATRGKKEEEV